MNLARHNIELVNNIMFSTLSESIPFLSNCIVASNAAMFDK